MRSASSALLTILNGQSFERCNLFEFTTLNGSTNYWTDAGVDVKANGNTYSGDGVSFKNFRYKLTRGLTIDEFDIEVLSRTTDTINGVNWNTAAMSGALDEAQLVVHKAFLLDWFSNAETVDNVFSGYVSECNAGEIAVGMHVVSNADKLNVQLPRLLIQPTCTRTLGDEGCTVNLDSFAATGTINIATSRYSFTTTLSAIGGYYALGSIKFTSGNNSGLTRTIKSFTALHGQIDLSYPLEFNVNVGDSFIVKPGCDKTRGANGCTKFSNLPNYKGFDYVPNPESVTS
jgi:uncharacterized phage protein (TIGR02218 family)